MWRRCVVGVTMYCGKGLGRQLTQAPIRAAMALNGQSLPPAGLG
jgi:hypothetical protein